jgi:hypothetical protein
MCLDYTILWLYLFAMVLIGFVWDIKISRLPVNMLGSVWTPILIAGDRLCSLILALHPELLQNWLNMTSNSEGLQDFEKKGLLLAKVEPLIYLTNKKTEFSTSSANNLAENSVEVAVESIPYT